jgi:very-short-patch-repair endonuclease
LAARQHGVFTGAQARELGVSRQQLRSRVANGGFGRVFPGVFRVEGAPEEWKQLLRAVLLWAGPGAALSHQTAAALKGFSRFRSREVHLLNPRDVRLDAQVTQHFSARLRPADLDTVDGLTITSPTRTLFDLAAVEPAPDVRACVDEALRRRWTTLERLEQGLRLREGRPGVVVMRQFLDELTGAGGPLESDLEAEVLELLDAHDFPRPERQKPFYAGGRLRRVDFIYSAQRVVIEAGGYAYHSGLADFEKDRERLNALRVRGFTVLQWTWRAVKERSSQLAAQLAHVMFSEARQRGG